MKRLVFLMLAMSVSYIMSAQMVKQPNLSSLNTGFIQNAGQILDQYGKPNKAVRYISSNSDFNLALNQTGFSYEFFVFNNDLSLSEADLSTSSDYTVNEAEIQQVPITSSRVDVTFVNINPAMEIIAEHPLASTLNFYRSASPEDAFTGVKGFEKVTYKNLYKGIDFEFSYNKEFKHSPLAYRIILHPGADPSDIKMKYNGARFIEIGLDKELKVGSTMGELTERGLYGFNDQTKEPIACQYKMAGDKTIGFDIKSSNEFTTVIDPELVWGTYFGGKGSENFDTESEIALDYDGRLVISGSTASTTGISSTGAYQTTFAGVRDIFVAKFNTDGRSVVWATYYGGTGKDVAYAVDIDTANNIYIGGLTLSAGMATAGAYKTIKTGPSDALIARFNSDGLLTWATYFGGADDTESEHVRGLQILQTNELYVCGYITSTGLGTTGVAQPVYGGGGDAFVARFLANGTPKWMTYLGGTAKDRAHTVIARREFVYFTGTAKSKTGMSTPGAYQVKGMGGDEGFLTKLDTTGQMVWSTYYGGTSHEHGRSVVLDEHFNIYINGWTRSTSGIATPGAYMETKNPAIVNGLLNDDAYIAKFNPDGELVWGTYYGGEENEYAFNMVKDLNQHLYFCGKTGSDFNISTPDAFQVDINGSVDGFIAEMDTSGNLLYGSYFGGANVDQIFDMIFDTSNNLFFNLSTTSNLTTTPGAYKEKLGGGTDLAVFKFNQNAGCSDNLEDNNVKETAPEIVVSNNLNTYGISSKISSPSDEDWYKVVLLNKEPNLKISLLNLSVPMNIQLYNSSGVLLAQTEGSAGEDKTLIYNATAGGTYYIYIAHDSTANDSTGCYTLQVIKSSTAFLKEWSSSSSASGITLQITPNLVISDLNLELTVPTDGITNFIITDALGRQIITISEDVTAGKNTCHQDVSKLAPGLYRVINRTGTVVTYNSFVISR